MQFVFKDLRGMVLGTVEDLFGSVQDIYIDDQSWQIRYMVASTGPWLFGREVLIPRKYLKQPDMDHGTWPLELSKAEIEEKAKDASTAPPVSEQKSRVRLNYDTSPFLVAPEVGVYSPALAEQLLAETEEHAEAEKSEDSGDPHLRSLNELLGYEVEGRDGPAGTVHDFVIEPGSWCISHVVIDTGKWLRVDLAIVERHAIETVDWESRKITTSLENDVIEKSAGLEVLGDLKRDSVHEARAYMVAPTI